MKTVPRLIDTFIPTRYMLNLSLEHYEDNNRSFSGDVSIIGTLKKGNEILLHAKDLDVDFVFISEMGSNGKTKKNKKANFSYGEFDTLTISADDLRPGEYFITIAYHGKVTDAMHGLYPCYFTHDGTKKHLLATQFESHHAREVFPCVDEPAAKATYDLMLITKPGLTTLSNMPAKWTEEKNGLMTTCFEQTPRMSSYLLAFVVGELHKKTAHTTSGVEVNIWATPAQSEETLDFALDIATRSIDFYDEYFGVPYPLPKSDHVASLALKAFRVVIPCMASTN